MANCLGRHADGDDHLVTQAFALHTGNDHWQTMVFTVLTLTQMWQIMAIRSDRDFLVQQGLFSTMPLLGAVMLTIVLQLGVIYVPLFNPIFSLAPLTGGIAGLCCISSIVFVAVELTMERPCVYTQLIPDGPCQLD